MEFYRRHGPGLFGGRVQRNGRAGESGRSIRRRALVLSHADLSRRGGEKRWSLDSYDDAAVGYLEKNESGKLAITRVILQPKVVWPNGVVVSQDELEALHHIAHQECFIASSVKTDVSVEPQA